MLNASQVLAHCRYGSRRAVFPHFRGEHVTEGGNDPTWTGLSR